MEDFKESRNLKYYFTDDERSEIGIALANKNQELRELEDQKKSVMSDYSSRMNVTKEEINQASNKVASGYEMRGINCIIQYHLPEQGMKTITRTDIDADRDGMKKTWTERMTQMDYNLWTQYKEENEEEVFTDEGEGDEIPHPDARIEPAKADDITEVDFEEPAEAETDHF